MGRLIEDCPAAVLKQQGDTYWPIPTEVERSVALWVSFIDALWGSLQYPFDVLFRPTNDSCAQSTVIIPC